MNYRTHIYTIALLLCALLLASTSASAQARIGTVQGTIKDPDGALISGASVTLTQTLTGYQQSTQTDAQGVFKLVNIPFNSYLVRAEATGFQATEQHVDLETAVPYSLEIKLAVGAATETVTVEADADHAEHDKISTDTDISQS
ncbi:MAG: carboxypeptidase regulatory-like domain-containing protein, partial [Acidobacteria bacterium]|nr:carboxypeptidase regulatory-like domain-containing protein [Acidobacteriota bacterium]